MPDDAGRMIEDLIGPTDPEVSCEECFDMLDIYVELELANRPADAELPLMRAHLRGCSACRADYESLRALLLAGPDDQS